MAESSGPCNKPIGITLSGRPIAGSKIAFEWRHSAVSVRTESGDRWYAGDEIGAAKRLCKLADAVVAQALVHLDCAPAVPTLGLTPSRPAAQNEPGFEWIDVSSQDDPATLASAPHHTGEQPSWLKDALASFNRKACVRLTDEVTVRVVLSIEGDDGADLFGTSRTSHVSQIMDAVAESVRSLSIRSMTTTPSDKSPEAIVRDSLEKMAAVVSREPIAALICGIELQVQPSRARPGGNPPVNMRELRGVCDGVRDQSHTIYMRTGRAGPITALKFCPGKNELRDLFIQAQKERREVHVTYAAAENGSGEVTEAALMPDLFATDCTDEVTK